MIILVEPIFFCFLFCFNQSEDSIQFDIYYINRIERWNAAKEKTHKKRKLPSQSVRRPVGYFNVFLFLIFFSFSLLVLFSYNNNNNNNWKNLDPKESEQVTTRKTATKP